jgi:1-deoxy-D-xylulose-5-phosphate synthase
LPDRFVDHGDPAILLGECGLDADGIGEAIRRRFPDLVREARVKSVA